MKHLVWVVLALLGILFLLHNYMSHGGVAGVKQGIGLNGFGGGY